MDSLRIIPLGTNGWMPGDGRETACTAVVYGDALILLDCGTGVRRLRDERMRQLLNSARRVYIFISHYHLDHIAGIIFLPGLLAGCNVCIAGPGKELSGITTREALGLITTFPIFSHSLDTFPMQLELRDLTPGENSFPHFALLARKQEMHTVPSTGMRIDDALAYATDTSPDDGTITLAAGAGTLIHESWLDIADYEEAQRTGAMTGRGHTHSAGAARIAAEAGVKKLGLTHLNPFYTPEKLAAMLGEAQAVFCDSYVMFDLVEPG